MFVGSGAGRHWGEGVRRIGGAIFFSGMLRMAWNTWRAIRGAQPADYDTGARIPLAQNGETGR